MREIVTIRQVVSLIGQEYGYSLHRIGKLLGQDHSTIHHNKIMATSYCNFEPEYLSMVLKVKKELTRPYPMYNNNADTYRCSECEVFTNFEEKEGIFALGFFCPIKQKFVLRDDDTCKWMISDNLPLKKNKQ
jgi:predicted hydrocarbon binding protein